MIDDSSYYEQQQPTDADWEAYERHLDEMDRAYRATLTAQQRLDYMVHTGELAAVCPACGKRYVDVEHGSHPDMVGTAYWTEFQCCGHMTEVCDAIEYDHMGRMVDIG